MTVLPPEIPQKVGPYVLEDVLGDGGMGRVYRAWDERLQRRVAVKRLHDAPDERQRKRLLREARTVAGLSHAAVVQVHDVLEQEGRPWIVMELLEGGTLADRLRRGLPEVAAAVGLGRRIAEGLAHAHGRGVIHRDLKVENVLLSAEGEVKITDFGLARRRHGNDTTVDGLAGTFRALAPELVQGHPADERSDLFALGVLLYETLTGRSPFRGGSRAETLERVVLHSPPPVDEVRPGVPHRLADLVEQLLDKEPNRRPERAARAAAVLAHVEAALSATAGDGLADLAEESTRYGSAPEVRGDTSTTRTAAPGARGRGPLVLGSVAFVLLLLALGWLGRPPRPLRILVLAPQAFSGTDASVAALASGVSTASTRALIHLRGVTVVDPSEADGVTGTPREIAHAVAADEVLRIAVEKRGGAARVTLERLDDGVSVALESFQVPVAFEEALLVASSVASHLGRIYEDRAPRRGLPELRVDKREYAAFMEVKKRLDSGVTARREDLDELAAVSRSAPAYLEVHLLAATVAFNLARDLSDADLLTRAETFLQRAARLDADSPRVLGIRVLLATARGDSDAAEEVLSKLEEATPGDALVALHRSRIAERRGDLQSAIDEMQEAVRRVPAWRSLHRLARLEASAGHLARARHHLLQVLERSPGNVYGRIDLANLELQYGDLAAAEALLAELVAQRPHRIHWTNLGIARFLRGNFEAAALSYEKALELAPGHLLVTFNLADAWHASGRVEEAMALYRDVLTRLRSRAEEVDLRPWERAMTAQCLARLGQRREATSIVIGLLQQHGEDSEVLFQAALVYALLGDDDSAVTCAAQARAAGYQPRWFEIPAFVGLRQDPGFRELLKAQPDEGSVASPASSTKGSPLDIQSATLSSPPTRAALK